MLGFIKVILILWIANTIYRWYKRSVAGKERPNSNVEPPERGNPGTVYSGRIEDAEFEEIDSDADQAR